MKKNFIKKLTVSTMLIVSLVSTVALASGDSCSFKFANQTGSGYLHVNWNWNEPDQGWSETSHPGESGYVTTTYIEGLKNGSVVTKDFKYGATYSSTDSLRADATRFNSTHAMASGDNVYKALTHSTCTDW